MSKMFIAKWSPYDSRFLYFLIASYKLNFVRIATVRFLTWRRWIWNVFSSFENFASINVGTWGCGLLRGFIRDFNQWCSAVTSHRHCEEDADCSSGRCRLRVGEERSNEKVTEGTGKGWKSKGWINYVEKKESTTDVMMSIPPSISK